MKTDNLKSVLAASLRLFRAIQIEQHPGNASDPEMLKLTLAQGYILDPDIPVTPRLRKQVEQVIGLSGEQANASFHKSWNKVRTEKIEELVIEQLLHYMTTYGFKDAGLYDESTVFVPVEKLDIPELTDDIPLTFVRGITAQEALSEIIKLGAGAALTEKTLNDILTIVEANKYQSNYLSDIKNHELSSRLYQHYGITPDEPVDYLRYVIYRITGQTLLIKNDEMIESIKALEADKRDLMDALLEQAPDNLGSIFNRFKPLFLAMKAASGNKRFFNRLRKRAKTQHVPLQQDYLSSVTQQIKENRIDCEVLAAQLKTANIYRVIRLLYALEFRKRATESVIYPVRNGRGWATGFEWPDYLQAKTVEVYDVVFDALVQHLQPKVAGQTFYVPDYVHYALPQSEKQFAGPYPLGSYVTANKEIVFGIHWYNVDGEQTDLDLSLMSATTKVGWDAEIRNDEVLFSGDLTDAPTPNGASELYHVKGAKDPYMVMLNYFNYSAVRPVPSTVMVSNEAPTTLKNHTIDQNKIVAKASVTISKKQTLLGLVKTVGEQTRFYFSNVGVGGAISSSENEVTAHSRRYLNDRLTSTTLDLSEVLRLAGATVVNARPDSEFVDLSPEQLSQSRLLNLLF